MSPKFVSSHVSDERFGPREPLGKQEEQARYGSCNEDQCYAKGTKDINPPLSPIEATKDQQDVRPPASPPVELLSMRKLAGELECKSRPQSLLFVVAPGIEFHY